MTEWVNSSINSDPLMWKRRVVERCLYGVDFNPLAHELAKLALWLSSASAGKPLTFLDHHLKVGNSLYGTPLNRLSMLPTTNNGGKQDLFQGIREQTIQAVVEKLDNITGTDSDHIDDVKYKSEVNRSIIDFTQRLRDIANVWLGTLFGLQNHNGKPLDEQEYQQFLEEATLNYTTESWELYVHSKHALREARNLAILEKMCFFHWELEFPDTVVSGRCQFDAIIANPPYVGTQPNLAIMTLFETAKCRDIYSWLFELSLHFIKDSGAIGMIVPLSLMFSRDMKSLRKLLLKTDTSSYVSAFDATRDGIFQPNGESRNGQRVSIVIYSKQKDKHHLYTTNLMRWIGEERPFLLSNLRYADVTTLATEEVFPKLGDPVLATWAIRSRVWRFLQYNFSL